MRSVLRDQRATPVKAIVDARADEVVGQTRILGRAATRRSGPEEVLIAEIHVEVLELGRPVRRKAPFEADTSGPTGELVRFGCADVGGGAAAAVGSNSWILRSAKAAPAVP